MSELGCTISWAIGQAHCYDAVRRSRDLAHHPEVFGLAEKNKNQTAAERAALAEALSGQKCTKCGKDVKLKDLLNVKHISFQTRRKEMMTYHRACYTA
jgi:hypothetical protein